MVFSIEEDELADDSYVISPLNFNVDFADNEDGGNEEADGLEPSDIDDFYDASLRAEVDDTSGVNRRGFAYDEY